MRTENYIRIVRNVSIAIIIYEILALYYYVFSVDSSAIFIVLMVMPFLITFRYQKKISEKWGNYKWIGLYLLLLTSPIVDNYLGEHYHENFVLKSFVSNWDDLFISSVYDQFSNIQYEYNLDFISELFSDEIYFHNRLHRILLLSSELIAILVTLFAYRIWYYKKK